MKNFAILAFLALAGLLLLFGCAANGSRGGGTPAGGSGSSQLSEGDVSLLPDTTSGQVLGDLPVDDGSAATQGTTAGGDNSTAAGAQLTEADVSLVDDTTSGQDMSDLPVDNWN